MWFLLLWMLISSSCQRSGVLRIWITSLFKPLTYRKMDVGSPLPPTEQQNEAKLSGMWALDLEPASVQNWSGGVDGTVSTPAGSVVSRTWLLIVFLYHQINVYQKNVAWEGLTMTETIFVNVYLRCSGLAARDL